MAIKPLPRDISFYQPDADVVSTSRKCYNYRLSYRLSIASFGSPSFNAFHGSSIVRKSPKKENETTYQLLYEDAHSCSFGCNMWNRNFFIYPDSLLEIFESDYFPSSDLPINLDDEKEFVMSERSKSKIKDKMFSMYRSRFRNYTFCTLSFVNNVTDKASQQVLNKFFTQLRKKYPNFQYLWVAERQDGKRNNYEHCTNNIHFHIFFDRFIPIALLNKYWLIQQYNSGIEHPNVPRSQLDVAYKNNDTQKLLNPVDVKTVRGVNGMTYYMTKYVTKNKTILHCRAWHCSRGVSRLFTSCAVNRSTFSLSSRPSINYSVNRYTGEVIPGLTITTDYAVINTIANKRFFLPYMRQMEFINAQILDGHKFSPEDFKLELFTALQTSFN